MNWSTTTTASTSIANGGEPLYLGLAAICLIMALHFMRRALVPVGPLVRVFRSAAVAILAVAAAFALLVLAIGWS